ncbi:hypothetical protein FRC09_000758, partial [Ceratobasidium sp. 395]
MSDRPPAMHCCLCNYSIITDPGVRATNHEANKAYQMKDLCEHIVCQGCAWKLQNGPPFNVRCPVCGPKGYVRWSRAIILKEIFISETHPPLPVITRQMKHALDME